MNIYLDTANVKDIKEAVSQGSVDGITTNPSLAAKEGRNFKELFIGDLQPRRWSHQRGSHQCRSRCDRERGTRTWPSSTKTLS